MTLHDFEARKTKSMNQTNATHQKKMGSLNVGKMLVTGVDLHCTALLLTTETNDLRRALVPHDTSNFFFFKTFFFYKSGRLAEKSVEQSWQIFTGARLTVLAKFGGGVRGIAKQFILEFEKECAPTHFVDQGWHGLCGTHVEGSV